MLTAFIVYEKCFSKIWACLVGSVSEIESMVLVSGSRRARSPVRGQNSYAMRRYDTTTRNHRSSLNCDLCEADDNVQDEQHVLFHCTHPQVVSLRRKYAPLFSQAGSHDVSAFLNQNNHTLPFFLHEIVAFYEQASSRNS